MGLFSTASVREKVPRSGGRGSCSVISMQMLFAMELAHVDQRKRGFRTIRAPRFIANTITISSSAPPHACACHDLYGEIA